MHIEAYLQAHRGQEAAAEFQKIVDHRGTVVNEPYAAVARLELGRAYAMQGDTSKARGAYQDFLTLWKNADPDIPILASQNRVLQIAIALSEPKPTSGANDRLCRKKFRLA